MVEIHSTLFACLGCIDSQLIHPFFGRALHVPTECQPPASPAGELGGVVEPAAHFTLSQEFKANRILQRLFQIYPEYERIDAIVCIDGLFVFVGYGLFYRQIGSFFPPLIAQRMLSVLIVPVR